MPKLILQVRWILLAAAALAIALAPAPTMPAAAAERVIRLEASSFEYRPAVIRVEPGDRVTLEVVATDGVHGVYLDGYDLKVTAEPGQTARLVFTADRQGSFRLRCSVTCGPLHPFMIGKLQVGPNWTLWRTGALALAAAVFGFGSVRQGSRRWP